MKKKSIGFIGGGRITRIMLHAFANHQIDMDQITVCDVDEGVLEKLKNEFPSIQICYDPRKPAYQELMFVALHPPAVIQTLKSVVNSVGKNTIVVSLAPKISIDQLSSVLNTDNIIRMIPNATSFISKGYNPICFAPDFPVHEKIAHLKLLKTLGHTFETDEQKLESYAIISAMLPTYFWFQWDELEKIGLKIGLDSSEAKEAIHETLLGATQLFYNSDLSHEEVMDLIPLKPVAEHEQYIRDCFNDKLVPLFEKIKPAIVAD